jgi:glycosyltransferase involved in cell wall biosynthesis
MRIALIGPYAGATLSAQFPFAADGASLPAGYPGAPLMTALAKALVERGHQVGCISTDYTTPVDQLEPFRAFHAPGVTAYFCPQRPHSFRSAGGRRGRSLDHFKFERECLLAAIKDFAPDLIHAHWTYEFVWAALDSGVPTLATAHDSPAKVLRFTPNLYRASRYLMARHVLARCRHLTAVSPDLAADLRHWTNAPISVVPNPIPNDVLTASGCTATAFASKSFVMVLNGWTSLKNGATALRAFSRARHADPQLQLVCFGAGFESGGEAHRWAKAHGFDVNVSFRGPVPHRAIIEQMCNSTALLHPSRWEACCMSIAEAMSVGLPVIAGRKTDGVPWQLDNGAAGALVDVTDADALAASIVGMAGDEAQWQRWSVAARERARRLFSSDAVVGRYLNLYAGLRGDRAESSAPVAAIP